MAEYIHFTPQSKNLSAPASGTSGVLGFVSRQEVLSATVSADTMADWITLSTQHIGSNVVNYTVAQNNTGAERTAVISIAAKVQLEGEAESFIDYDITTLRQESQNAGTGSILPQYTSFTPKAEGDSGVCTFTTSNIIPSTISISCDQPYVDVDYLTDASAIKTGFTWSVGENNTVSSRQFTVTINARRASGDGYAYAYVSGVQPSINNVGWILFQYDTVRSSATTMSSSINFETEFVPHIASAITDEYWLHATFVDVQSGQTPNRYEGTMDFTIDENPYNQDRQGQITLFGTSEEDESLVQTTLHFYQAKNPTGGAQTGFIFCNNPVIYLPSPEAMSNPTTCQFKLSYANMDVSSVSVMDFSGNFNGMPVFNDSGKTALTFAVNNATSTTDYTMSQILVNGEDDLERVIPPIILTVMQPPYVDFIEFPIWKDTDLIIPTQTEYLLYKITINSTIVYAGRAYTMDGEVKIRLNEIMQQVLMPDLDLTKDGLQDNNAYASALFSISADGVDYQKYKQIKCYADWSYVDDKRNILSKPIRKKLDSRQIFVCTAMDYAGNGPSIVMSLTDESGSTRDNVYALSNQIGTIVQKDITGVEKIEIYTNEGDVETTEEYEVVCELGRYCLYYLNIDGGWDSFVFNKTSKEKDTFERLKYSTNQSNQTIRHRTIEYKNKIKKTWTLKTDYLTDTQSLNFAENLVGSPCVYLHDLEEGKIYPVLINTNSIDYQTFRRNGKKLNKYSIEVELAQNRQRR